MFWNRFGGWAVTDSLTVAALIEDALMQAALYQISCEKSGLNKEAAGRVTGRLVWITEYAS